MPDPRAGRDPTDTKHSASKSTAPSRGIAHSPSGRLHLGLIVALATAALVAIAFPLADSGARADDPSVLATSPGLYVVNPDPEPQVEPQPEPEEEATPEAEPTPEPAPEPTPEPQPAFSVYTVQPGDSVASIAAAFGIDIDYIVSSNPDLYEDPDLLLVGQELLIPSVNGLIYTVKLGDTLFDIASFYQIDVQSIFAFASNGIASADTIVEGMVLLLPGAVLGPPIPAAVAAVGVTTASDSSSHPTSTPDGELQCARTLTVWATWYTAASAGGSGVTYTGTTVQKGTVAVDPSVIPLGTRMYIPGYGYGVAEDTGGAILGNMIDLGYGPNDIWDWGSRYVDICILD